MANMNIRTPRFYCDSVNYRLSRGIPQDGRYDVQDTNTVNDLVGLKSGTESELFDMRPLNVVTFDTAASTASKADGVVVTMDLMGETDSRTSFVAILNHNMATATARFMIAASDTKAEVEIFDWHANATKINPSQIVNADTIDGSSPYEVTPGTDGSTIVTFTPSHLRYWGIQFEGSDSDNFSSTDLTVGCILIGEFYDMPVSPDLNVKRTVIFDKVDIKESIGGQRYSNMTSHGRTAADRSKSPFSTATVNQQVFGGRLTYDMNFSYIASTDLMPDEYDIYNPTDDSVVEDIWNKTNGPHLPFIFSCDNSSTGDNAESEHIFARFSQNSLEQNQVANDVFNISMKIEEEF